MSTEKTNPMGKELKESIARHLKSRLSFSDDPVLTNLPDMSTLEMRLRISTRAIMNSILVHEADIMESIAQAVESNVAAFSELAIRKTKESVSSAISDAIDSYFKYGHGREIVNEVVETALDKVFKSGKEGD